MEREEARMLLKEHIAYLTASLIYQDSGTEYSPAEIDALSRKIEALRRDLAAL